MKKKKKIQPFFFDKKEGKKLVLPVNELFNDGKEFHARKIEKWEEN